MPSPRHWLLATATAIALVATIDACREPTKITVLVTTDVSCADTPSATIIVGSVGEIESKAPVSTSTRCDSGQLGSLVIVPSGASNALVAFKIVEGYAGTSPSTCVATNDFSKCIVARRALEYLPHKSLTVPVTMTVSCLGVTCDEKTTCVAGQCVPATIDDPEQCDKPDGCQLVPPDAGKPDAAPDAGKPDAAPDASDAARDASDAEGGVTACLGSCVGPISAGREFSCAVQNGNVTCWGDNASAELGRGASGGFPNAPGPTVPPITNAAGLITDGYATCAQDVAGALHCWGYQTAFDQIGRNAAMFASPQTFFPPDTTSVWMTNNDTIYWLRPSGLFAAGGNNLGQLGVGDTLPRSTPVMPMVPSGAIRGLGMVGDAACAIIEDAGTKSVWCWGTNTSAEVDVNDMSASVPLPRKKDLSGFPAVANVVGCQQSCSHACAIMADTSAVCWGQNIYGQLGRSAGGLVSRGAPDYVVLASSGMPLKGVTALGLGFGFTCAIVGGGKVACWGASDGGQLGRGGMPEAGAPPAPSADFVVGLANVTSLAVGYDHACAKTQSGEVWCWGNNANGAVGSSTLGPVATPFRILP